MKTILMAGVATLAMHMVSCQASFGEPRPARVAEDRAAVHRHGPKCGHVRARGARVARVPRFVWWHGRCYALLPGQAPVARRPASVKLPLNHIRACFRPIWRW